MKRTDSNDPLINFRTPLDKKLLADALARRRGFKNVSDLMNALLNAAIDDEWSKVELEALLKMISPTDPKAKGRNNKAARTASPCGPASPAAFLVVASTEHEQSATPKSTK